MSYVIKEVECQLCDFDDDAIVEYLENQGYEIHYKDSHMRNVFDYYSRGDIIEALYQLEVVYPQLKGISNKVKTGT